MTATIPLDVWKAIAADTPMLAPSSGTAPTDKRRDVRMRTDVPLDIRRAVAELATARQKALRKWTHEHAARIVGDRHGVEMASSHAAASHKAARFVRVLGPNAQVVDLCCGIGGDAMALVHAGLRVTAVDRDPVRAWMAESNARCPSLACDVLDPSVPDGPFHLDPARRDDSGKRSFFLDALQPPPPVIRRICAGRSRVGGALKLGPGIGHDDALSLSPGELEFISERGTLTQCVLWTGRFALAERSATLLDAHQSHTLSGEADASTPPTGPLARFISEIDASIERAGLLNRICDQTRSPMLHPKLGLLTSDDPAAHPMCEPFEVLAELPWNLKRCRAELARWNAGIVEVKTRGKVVDTDVVQKQLRGDGDATLAAFILRFDRAVRCIIARRVKPHR